MKRLVMAITAATLAGCLAASTTLPYLAAAPSVVTLADLAFVSLTDGENLLPSSFVPGCNTVSVLHVYRDEPVHRGRRWPLEGGGRLAATSDFSFVLSGPGGLVDPMLALQRPTADWTTWTDVRLTFERMVPAGGIAILPDDETLLISVAPQPVPQYPMPPPFYVERFLLSEMHRRDDSWALGPSRGRIRVPSAAAEILPTADGRRAYVVTEYGTVLTIDPSTMAELEPPIQLQPPEPDVAPPPGIPPQPAGLFVGGLHALLTADERYLVVNRFRPPQLNVADLQTHDAWTLATSPDVVIAGGIALNKGWVNPGLLALHAVDKVIVYRFNPHGPLQELSRFPAAKPLDTDGLPGPTLPVAWSTSGAELIFGNNIFTENEGGFSIDQYSPEFTILGVRQGGAELVRLRDIVLCPGTGQDAAYQVNDPHDILTANGRVTPPPSPTSTSPPSATHTPTATATASPSPTASLPTPAVHFAYLPLAARSACTPRRKHADVALVLDASTSMRRLAPSGRTKLQAAQAAALSFLDLMRFTPDATGSHDQVAIVAFNNSAWIQQPLSANSSRLAAAIDTLTILVAPGTRLDLALRRGTDALTSPARRPDNAPVLILLTDGLPTNVPTPAPSGSPDDTVLRQAQLAKQRGFLIYTIGLGQPDAADADARLNPRLLRQIATRPDMYFQTPNAEELAAIYAQIAYTITCPAGP